MFSWELALSVRKRVCELTLWRLYDRYGNVILQRRCHPEMGPSWHKKDDVLAALHREIRRELEEIRFLRSLMKQTELGRLVLHRQQGEFHNVEKGPSIVELMEQHIANLKAAKAWAETEYGQLKIATAEELLDIVYNPYNYLTPQQQQAYSDAEQARMAIVENRAGPVGETPTRRPAGKHGPTLAQARAQAQEVTRGGPG